MSEQSEVAGVDYKNLEDENIKIANRIAMERTIRVDEIARKIIENKGNVAIRFRIPEGETVNAFGEKETLYRNNDYIFKTFTFRKIATGDWNLYVMKRAELQNEIMKPADQADQTKIADLNNRIYEFLAMKYLGISHDDYVRAEWDDAKLMIEACNHLTENAVKDFEIKQAEENIGVSDRFTPLEAELGLDTDTKTINKLSGDNNNNNSSSKKYYEYND